MLAATQDSMMWQVEEKFAMLVGAICHDLDHPGVNNAFLINTRDVRALRYNDASVLENVHVATLYQLVGESPETNVFQYLEEDLSAWTRVRKIIVSIIMHTDMIHHFSMVRLQHRPCPPLCPPLCSPSCRRRASPHWRV
jgi:cAMP-specific phosphodiesterase 4